MDMSFKISSVSRRFSAGKISSVSAWRVGLAQYRHGGRDVGRNTCCSNRQWSFYSLDLSSVDETRMCHEAHADAFAASHVPGNILGSETVAHRAQFLHSQVARHLLEHRFDNGIRLVGAMAFALGTATLQPFHDIGPFLDSIALEEIRHDDEIAVRGVLVSDELGVDQVVTPDIRDEQDRVRRILRLGVGEVRLDCSNGEHWSARGVENEPHFLTFSNVLHLAFGLAFVLDTNGAAFSWWMGCHFNLERVMFQLLVCVEVV